MMIKNIFAALAVLSFIAIGAASASVTYRLAHKICDQNGMNYSVWRDRCVER